MEPVVTLGKAVIDSQRNAPIDITFIPSDLPVSALQFDIQYPNEVLAISAVADQAAISAGKSIWTASPKPGVGRILIVGLNRNPIATGVLAKLSVQLKAGTPPGFYAVAISNALASDGNGQGMFLTAGNGTPIVATVANAASYVSGTVAPGEIIVIGGTSLAPATVEPLQSISPGMLPTSLGSTSVFFDGTPAPLIYVLKDQLSAIVPYAVDGRIQTAIQVEYAGTRSAPLVVPVSKTAPGIFTMNLSGSGQGAIVNQDGTINGPGNPAPRDSVVLIYGTGEGQTFPPGIDGSITSAGDLRRPVSPVTASIGNQSAEVLYAGSAPGQVAGLMQVNVRIPASTPPGNSVPVTIAVNGSSQAGVTMAVR